MKNQASVKTTTVFQSGKSLAVRLPKGYQLPIGRVVIERKKGTIILRATDNGWPENFDELFPTNNPITKDWVRPEQGENNSPKTW
jgi:virulence-associated protein VagC